MNILVFDIETIPDIAMGRKLYDLKEAPDSEVAAVMFQKQKERSATESEFLPHHLHRVAAISTVLKTSDQINVWSLGDEDADEKEIISRFFAGIDKYRPTLVSWNGSGFDLPVLHYRALHHGIVSLRYWETGEQDPAFRFNNYLSRYHARHTDVMDMLASYQSRAFAPLDQIALLIGLPGKMGMDGSRVWDAYQAGEIQAIRNYCETDVLNTYLIYQRFRLIQGHLTEKEYESILQETRDFLQNANQAHFSQFLKLWTERGEKELCD